MNALAFFICITSLFIGSFIALVAIRAPVGTDWRKGRSKCPSCHATLSPADLVPLMSFALARGKCRHCGAPIGIYYPGVELAALGVGATTIFMAPPHLWAISLALGFTLTLLGAIDIKHMRLPDVLTLPLLGTGLVYLAWWDTELLLPHVLAVVAGFLLFFAISRVYEKVRERPGLGLGDAKLFGAGGAWVGLTGLPSVLLIAAISGLIWVFLHRLIRPDSVSESTRIPFGPWLCLGIWITWVFGPLVPW